MVKSILTPASSVRQTTTDDYPKRFASAAAMDRFLMVSEVSLNHANGIDFASTNDSSGFARGGQGASARTKSGRSKPASGESASSHQAASSKASNSSSGKAYKGSLLSQIHAVVD